MEMVVVITVLVGFSLLLCLPYILTRFCLTAVANMSPDPRLPEAARGVRRTAWFCVLVTIVAGLAFSAYCYHNSVTYSRGNAWVDLGAELWLLACFLPVGALFEVAVAVAIPVRISLAPSHNLGFRRG